MGLNPCRNKGAIMALVSIGEYADMHGKDHVTLRQAAASGKFKTAVKIAGRWLIDSDEPLVDRRTREHRSSKYPNNTGC